MIKGILQAHRDAFWPFMFVWSLLILSVITVLMGEHTIGYTGVGIGVSFMAILLFSLVDDLFLTTLAGLGVVLSNLIFPAMLYVVFAYDGWISKLAMLVFLVFWMAEVRERLIKYADGNIRRLEERIHRRFNSLWNNLDAVRRDQSIANNPSFKAIYKRLAEIRTELDQIKASPQTVYLMPGAKLKDFKKE